MAVEQFPPASPPYHVEPRYFTPITTDNLPSQDMTLGEILSHEEEYNLPLLSERKAAPKESKKPTLPMIVNEFLSPENTWTPEEYDAKIAEVIPDLGIVPVHNFYQETPVVKK